MAIEEFLSQSWPSEESCVSPEDTCVRALRHSVPSWEQSPGNVPTGQAHRGFHSSSSSSWSIMLPRSLLLPPGVGGLQGTCFLMATTHPYFTDEETETQ